jgi:cbb3-type cytochrome oxidase maturation protein
MNIIILLVILSLIVAGGFLIAFIWSVKNGQYEDIEGPSNRILFEDKINKD